jgi:hypothetical protein
MRAARWIAEAIGPRLLYPLEFPDGERVVDAPEITALVEEALLTVRDDLVPMLVSGKIEHRESIRNMLGTMVAKRLTRRYEVVKVDRNADWIKPSRADGNWWEAGDLAP